MRNTIRGGDFNKGIVRTTEKCRGCNKCLNGCPVFCANVAVEEDGNSRIYVDQDRCILCGHCFDLCTHEARVYVDDTDLFLLDLQNVASGKRDKKISLIIDPSFIINYPTKYNMILGYLKHLGINHILSASFGGDISVWSYVKYMQSGDYSGMIAQTCPAIVNSIEKYHPKLLDKVIPVQSPLMSTAIYMRKYLHIDDDIAFLGPCISRKSEIQRKANAGNVQYSVTYEHLMKKLIGQDLSNYYAEDSELAYGMGALLSMQGGLRENLEYYLGLNTDCFINQKEGEKYAYSFLELYEASIGFEDPRRAKLIDIVNCGRGCNYGTATEFKHTTGNHIPHAMNQVRVEKRQMIQSDGPGHLSAHQQRLEALNERFKNLNPEDFYTSYQNRSVPMESITNEEIDHIFEDMLKFNELEQTLDCNGCGMNTCRNMATAIASGYNFKGNCVYYVKKKLIKEQSESIVQKHRYQMLQNAREYAQVKHIDQLTGLKNRFGFEALVENALKKARRTNVAGYVYLMDLDDFKLINDSYGTDFGNSLLMEFTFFLMENFGDKAELFRIGGDEFGILLEETDVANAREVKDLILKRTQKAWNVFGIRFYCTVSIGVVRFPEADHGVNDIIKNVELAMYKAKQQGKNTCVIFDPELDTGTLEHVATIRQMRDCVKNNFESFEVYYQPWVGVDGRIIGSESLLRWRNDNGQYVPPSVFIPIAESAGLINELGEYILREAALKCKEINKTYPDYVVSINVSAKQFNAPDVFDRLYDILLDTGVNLNNIYLEVTESLGIENVVMQRSIFDKLAEKGIKIALDDFGTGYSSLSYLNELPLDLVKVDRAFVKNIDNNTYSRHLLAMITELMHKMGRRVCVEGVETIGQLRFCQKYDVDIIQGFYFFRPMPSLELDELLHSRREMVGEVSCK